MEEEIRVILGPTASGKTALAVALAQRTGAEIISADSRQVYRGMDVGTGKDLAEYGDVPYHLIDIREAGEKYNLALFQEDFSAAVQKIRARGRQVVVCGGTGLYIQSLVQGFSDTFVPENAALRKELEVLPERELNRLLDDERRDAARWDAAQQIAARPSTRKRKIRALEITAFKKANPDVIFPEREKYDFRLFGLDPPPEIRRARISQRLKQRIQQEGMIAEVEGLIASGVSPEMLEYYGLEYKYITAFLLGFLRYDEMYARLETEIHRYAKRQMTFFRSMEKKGIKIEWVPFGLSLEEKVEYILKCG